ncbi:hypothetical protein HNY73_001934 [Argiope bruennichi]|uniref:Uncharacterized protein n=1 Tax=Argiope bruennichi TaxID=94029 RepID=A0A8T0FTD6_ARGBR|nr:hypothetical protein HNY73_001934 [Argiope bruennichi]
MGGYLARRSIKTISELAEGHKESFRGQNTSSQGEEETVSLHVFCDASAKAYATCISPRVEVREKSENLLEKRASEIEDEKEEAVQQQYVENLPESDKTFLPNLNTMKTRLGRKIQASKRLNL